jgi:hypothetical protein
MLGTLATTAQKPPQAEILHCAAVCDGQGNKCMDSQVTYQLRGSKKKQASAFQTLYTPASPTTGQGGRGTEP